MESIYAKLALYGIKNKCAGNDNVFFPICDGTVSLNSQRPPSFHLLSSQNADRIKEKMQMGKQLRKAGHEMNLLIFGHCQNMSRFFFWSSCLKQTKNRLNIDPPWLITVRGGADPLPSIFKYAQNYSFFLPTQKQTLPSITYVWGTRQGLPLPAKKYK